MRPKNTHPLGPPKPVLPCQTSEVAKRRLTLAVSGPTASLGGRKFRAQTVAFDYFWTRPIIAAGQSVPTTGEST